MSLSAKAAQRFKSLAKAGVDNKARNLLEHNLKLFAKSVDKPLTGNITYFKRDEKGNIVTDERYGEPIVESMSLGKPKGLTSTEVTVYDSIINEFLEDPTSTVKGIRSEFKKVQELREKARREYLESKISANTKNQELIQKSVDRLMEQWRKENEKRIKGFSVSDMAKDVDVYERMQKEVAIKEMIGSEQYKNMWTLSEAQNIKYEDMLEALYQVTVNPNEGNISITDLLKGDVGSSLSNPGSKLLDNRAVQLITGENDYMKDIESPTDWQSTAQLEDEVLRYLKEVMEVSR